MYVVGELGASRVFTVALRGSREVSYLFFFTGTLLYVWGGSHAAPSLDSAGLVRVNIHGVLRSSF